MTGDSDESRVEEDNSLGEGSEADELTGKLASSPDEERLAHSVLENDTDAVDDGKLIAEAINQSVGSFTPDILFQNLVSNYRNAKRLYGETLIRALTEYTPDYVRKNLNIPEFQEALRQRIDENVEALKDKGLVDDHGFITEKAERLAALVLYTEELDALVSKGLGKRELKERDTYGEKENVVPFTKGTFRFRDLSLKQSLKTAIRRGHTSVKERDLRAYERQHKGRIQVLYGLDASGSMRGEKLATSKKAGIALAFKALEDQNEAGLIIFTSKIEHALPPTRDFRTILDSLTRVRAGKETDMAMMILKSIELFSRQECTKHLLILSDAVPTKGKDPRKATLEAASTARDHGITISVVGIGLDKEGESLAREVVEVGEGRLYMVKNLEELDTIILQDYDALQ